MIECLVMGDSIAQGISQVRTECVAYVKSGINSYDWMNTNVSKSPFIAKSVIISLGANDTKHVKTYEELLTIRKLTKADRVYWIVPNIKPEVQQAVWKVANKFKDTVINSRNYDLSSDHLHPTGIGYKKIGEITK